MQTYNTVKHTQCSDKDLDGHLCLSLRTCINWCRETQLASLCASCTTAPRTLTSASTCATWTPSEFCPVICMERTQVRACVSTHKQIGVCFSMHNSYQLVLVHINPEKSKTADPPSTVTRMLEYKLKYVCWKSTCWIHRKDKSNQTYTQRYSPLPTCINNIWRM